MMSYDNGEPGVLLGFMVVLEMGTSLTPEFDTSWERNGQRHDLILCHMYYYDHLALLDP